MWTSPLRRTSILRRPLELGSGVLCMCWGRVTIGQLCVKKRSKKIIPFKVVPRPLGTAKQVAFEGTFARCAPSIQMNVPAIYHNALPPNITPSSSPGTLSTSTLYRANPNYLRNPKFCVGCFEFYLSKILRQHLKQGGKIFCDFFLRNTFLRSVLRQEFFLFLRFFCGTHFCEGPGVPWTLGLQSNPTQAYKC